MFINQSFNKLLGIFIVTMQFYTSFSTEKPVDPITFAAAIDNIITEPLDKKEIEIWNKYKNNIDSFILKIGHENQIDINTFYTMYGELIKSGNKLIETLQQNYNENIKPGLKTEKAKNKGLAVSPFMLKENKINENFKPGMQEMARNIAPNTINLKTIQNIFTQLIKNEQKETTTLETKLKTMNDAIAKQLNEIEAKLKNTKKTSTKKNLENEKRKNESEKIILITLDILSNVVQSILERIKTSLQRLEISFPYFEAIAQAHEDAEKLIKQSEDSFEKDVKAALQNYETAIEIYKKNEMIKEFLNTYNNLIEKLITADALQQAEQILKKAQQAQIDVSAENQKLGAYNRAQERLKNLEKELKQKTEEAEKLQKEKKINLLSQKNLKNRKFLKKSI